MLKTDQIPTGSHKAIIQRIKMNYEDCGLLDKHLVKTLSSTNSNRNTRLSIKYNVITR